jgi:hypothetical protein
MKEYPMSTKLLLVESVCLIAIAIALWSLGGFAASAYAQGCCGDPGGHGDYGGSSAGPSSPTAQSKEAKPEVKIAKLTEGDKAGIARQKVCPVTGEKLGSMGDPIKVLVGDAPIYLCCEGCVAKVKKDPETYLRKVKQAGPAK